MRFAVGQRWLCRAAPQGTPTRIVIGAIVGFPESGPIVCCTITGAPQKQADGSAGAATIPFVPMTEAAFGQSVSEPDGEGEVATEFLEHFEAWRDDERGLTCFTVPFESSLDRMIALQMAEIVGEKDAGGCA